ncbi:MAG: hypothetical protein JXR95_08955 [Deltaproteobacteria bacterium]|nr:hypothetical protein [Deltaproteobacteria bacterium]
MKSISGFLKKEVSSLNVLILITLMLTLSAALFMDSGLRNRKLPVHPYIEKSENIQKDIAQNHEKENGRLFIYFIDCLRYDYAIAHDKMPYLSSLLKESTWGKVTPCLSNMTVHCVESAFSGRDRSSLLSFSEDFHPRKSQHKGNWFFLMANAGYKISAVSDYVIPALYKDALTRSHVYKKGSKMKELVEKSIEYFNEKGNTVSIVHLLGPHDLGQAHGTVTAPYLNSLRETDDLLKLVTAQLRPEDTLLVFGDHGIDDKGKHTYNTDTPTFYLYRGRKFRKNHKQDINILSHGFFLSTLYNLHFHPDYQGEFYWDAITENASSKYGDEALKQLKRDKNSTKVKFSASDITLMIFFVVTTVILIWLYLGKMDFTMPLWLVLSSFILFSGFMLSGFIRTMPLVSFILIFISLIKNFKTEKKLLYLGLSVLITVFMILKGAFYTTVDIAIHEIRIYWIYGFYVFEILLSFFIVKTLRPGKSNIENFLTGAAISSLMGFVFHYSALYHYGIIRAIPFFLIVSIISSGILFYLKNHRVNLFEGLIIFISVAFLTTQISMFVENFRIFYFPYVPGKSGLINLVWSLSVSLILFYALAQKYSRSGKEKLVWIFGWAVTAVLGWGLIKFPPLFYAALLPVVVGGLFYGIFMKIPRWFLPFFIVITGVELGYMYEFSYGSLYQLYGFILTAFTMGYFAEKSESLPRRTIVSSSFILVSMMLIVTGFGFRTCGIDFKFAVRWLPELFEKLWAFVTLTAFFKYYLGIQLAFLTYSFSLSAIKILLKITGIIVSGMLPFVLVLYFKGGRATLIIDSLEEFLYMQGILLFMTAAVYGGRKFLSSNNSVVNSERNN